MTDEAWLALNAEQARTATAIFERMFPADDVPGATEIGVVRYLDRALAGAYREHAALYRRGLAQLDAASRAVNGVRFDYAPLSAQDALLQSLERGDIAGWPAVEQVAFFRMLRAHLQEGLFSDPAYGGNIDKAGWRVLGHPGVWLDNSAEENLSPLPVDKGGRIQSLADVKDELAALAQPRDVPGFDPQRGAAAPLPDVDVVLVGVGGVGGFIAPVLARAGLRVIGLEAGPWWDLEDFHPDELGHAYYCRAELGPKFKSEAPRWRTHEGAPDQELT
jgi:gluconate 2-dehydrogenase alpha chain